MKWVQPLNKTNTYIAKVETDKIKSSLSFQSMDHNNL